MRCIMCGKLITAKEEKYRMCMPCELDYLREYKKREEALAKLFACTEADLERYWHFEFNFDASDEANLYDFYEMLKLYSNSCRQWEEHTNGGCCVVERVRDKYLWPKIVQFVEDLKLK